MHIIDEDLVVYHGLKEEAGEFKRGYLAAMRAHDNAPTIIDSIKLMNPKPEDVILIKADINKISAELLNNLVLHTAKELQRRVIALPSTVSMNGLDVDYLDKWIEIAIKTASTMRMKNE